MNTIYPIFDDIREHRVRGRCIYPLNDLLKPKGRFFCNPTRRPTMRLQPLHPRPRFFVLFHPSKAHHPTIPPQKKEHSLLVLPSVNAILNFATKFFEMFTKKQSEHPQKVFQVFQVFRVFQVFHFAFGPQNRPILVQIRTNPANR